jgi:hypothetical protein
MSTTFTTTPASPVSGAMTVYDARAFVRQFARSAGDSSQYSNEQIDRALQACLSRFCRRTRALIYTTSASLAVDDTGFVVQKPPSNTGNPGEVTVMPEQLMSVRLVTTGEAITIISSSALEELVAAGDTDVDPQGAISSNWDSIGTGGFLISFWPPATVEQTVHAKLWLNATAWTPGLSDEDAQLTTLNLPIAWLNQILPYGPTALLQHNEPEHAYASPTWQKYLEVEQSFMGAGNLGRRVMIRKKRP